MKKVPIWVVGVAVILSVTGVVLAINVYVPEKQVQHRMDHLYGIQSPQFQREMSSLLGPAILAENQIEALENGDRIFPQMLQAIREARHTITFETYIYWSGDIGKQFAAALVDRSRAGVHVYVMLDWLGSEKAKPALLKEMNVYQADFARQMTVVFEKDLAFATHYTLDQWNQRPWGERLAETIVYPIRSQL
jgi:cardiolipin synthase A/B